METLGVAFQTRLKPLILRPLFLATPQDIASELFLFYCLPGQENRTCAEIQQDVYHLQKNGFKEKSHYPTVSDSALLSK
jgi:hypothetical protein